MKLKFLHYLAFCAVVLGTSLSANAQKVHRVPNSVADTLYLEKFIENIEMWDSGDIIMLIDPEYTITGTIDIFQEVTIVGDPALGKRPLLHMYDNGFRAKEDSMAITLKGMVLDGYDPNDGKTANHVLRFDQASFFNEYDVTIQDVEAYDFNGGIQLYKNQKTHYNSLVLDNVYFHDMLGDYVLDPRLNWVEKTTITNSTFANIKGFIKNYYNNNDGGNDGIFGTQTSEVLIDQNTFYLGASDAFIQQNDGHDSSLDFTFSNNIVSGLVDYENSRPFRIAEDVGTVVISNSVFHDFETMRTGGYNLDTLSLQANVTLTNISEDDPGYNRPDDGEFYVFSDIGDSEWRQSADRIVDLEGYIEDITKWEAGVPIVLTEPEYFINGTIDIFQEIVVEGADPNNPPVLHFYDNGFRAKEDSISITLRNMIADGYDPNDGKTANHFLRFDQAAFQNEYDVTIENVEAYDFNGGIQLYKNQKTHYNTLTLDNVYFHDMLGDYVIDPRLNYVETTTITNSTFANIKGFIKNFYNDNDGTNGNAWDGMTQTVVIDHNTFYNAASDAFIQQNDGSDGTLDMDFTNNIVSGLLDYDNSRPFRINEAVGAVDLTNSVFHDFETNRTGGYNLDTASLLTNVTLVEVTEDDPKYTDGEKGNFTPKAFAVYTGATDNGAQGDPEWILTDQPQDIDLEAFIEDITLWTAGVPIVLNESEYFINGTIDIFQEIVVEGADPNNPPVLHFYDNGFRAKEDSISITLRNMIADGYDPNDGKTANHFLRFDQAAFQNEYDVTIENVEAYDFNGGIQLYKNQKTHYNTLTLDNVYFHDMLGDYVIDPRLNYVETTTITNSTFANIKGFIKNFYNDNDGTNGNAWDGMTQTVVIDHNTFYNAASDAFIQQNDGSDGTLDMDFTNNIVSGLLDYDNSRPFRINEAVGAVDLTNSVFHDFETNRTGGYNLDTASLLTNVTLVEVTEDDPKYTDGEKGNFTPKAFAVYTGATDNGAQGDPEWILTDQLQDVDLEAYIEDITLWTAGVPIVLNESEYFINGTIDIFQEIVVEGADPNNPPVLHFYDNGFRAKEDSISITLRNMIADGYDPNDGKTANHFLRFDQAAFQNEYDVTIENVEAYDFNGGIQLYKNQKTSYNSLTLDSVYFHDMYGDYVLDPRLNYVANTSIKYSTFANIKGFIKNFYNDNDGTNGNAWDGMTQTVVIDSCTFYNAASDAFIQQNDGSDGTLDMDFTNNIVSGLLDYDNSRPFRINEAVGSVDLNNSVFHDFESNRDDGAHNLTAAEALANVTTASISTDDPQFINAGQYYFGNDALLTASTTGGAIGDPRWGTDDAAPLFIDIIEPGVVTADDIIQLEVETTVSEIEWSIESMGGTAMLSEDGELMAFGPGLVQVTVSDVSENTPSDMIMIDIQKRIIPVTSIELTATPDTISSAGTSRVFATIMPVDATDRSVMWSLSDDALATWSDAGVSAIEVQGAMAGTLTITGKAKGAEELTADVELVIQQGATGVEVASAGGDSTMFVGATLQFTATVTPEDAVNKEVVWTVDVDTLASIDQTGLLTALDTGVVVVTATSVEDDEVFGSMEIKIDAAVLVTGIEVTAAGGATSINIAQTLQLTATVTPEDAEVKDVTWSVDDDAVATISTDGVLTGVAEGTVVATATATDGSGVTGTISIDVLGTVTNINEVSDLATLYPNPSSTVVNLNVTERARVELMNISGQLLMRSVIEGKGQLNVSSLEPGLYIVKLTAGNKVQSIKLAIKE